MIPLSGNFLVFGVVEDSNDPIEKGRVRVRWIGIHTDDLSLIPTISLPWCNVLLPTTSASISGFGISPTGIVEGTLVCGIFLDPEDRQQVMVVGTLAGARNTTRGPSYGFNDPNGVYPVSGVNGDVNALATGDIANSTQMTDKATNRVKDLGVDSDPTVPPVVENVDFYKSAPWMSFATSYLGVSNENNPNQILQFQSVGGGVSSSNIVNWCAAFCGFCLNKAGIKGTGSALARSYMSYGNSVGKTNVPYGAIAIFQGSRGPSSGHVGFVVKDLGDRLTILGGNQTTDQSTGTTIKYDTGQVTQVNFAKTSLLDCRMPTNLNSIS